MASNEVDERTPLLLGPPGFPGSEPNRNKKDPASPTRFLGPIARFMILAGLDSAAVNSISGYAMLTDRAYVCAWYYAAINPSDPAQHGPHACRQPQIERTLARLTGALAACCGVITAISLLWFSKNMRRFGLKRLLIMNLTAAIFIMRMPYYLLPVGPPAGSARLWISPTSSIVVLALAQILYSLLGSIVLNSLLFRTMIIDVAPPSDLGRILSRTMIVIFISVAVAPTLNVAFTRWTDQRWGQGLWTIGPINGNPEPPLAHRSPDIPAPSNPVPTDETGHHPHAFLGTILLTLLALLWCVFFVHETPPTKPENIASASHADAIRPQRPRSWRRARISGVLKPLHDLVRPLKIFKPNRIRKHDGTSKYDWTFTRLATASGGAYCLMLMGQLLYEYLSYQFAFSGEQISLMLSALCAITSFVVLFGLPAAYAAFEERARRPIELRDMSVTQLKALGDEIDALESKQGPAGSGSLTAAVEEADAATAQLIDDDEGTPGHEHEVRVHGHTLGADVRASQLDVEDRHALHRAFSLWRSRVELLCSRTVLMGATIPAVLVALTLSVLNRGSATTGKVLLVLALFTGLVPNATGPMDAGALALIRARGGGTAQRDQYVTAMSFLHTCMIFVGPMIGNTLYAATLATPQLLHWVVALGLLACFFVVPARARY